MGGARWEWKGDCCHLFEEVTFKLSPTGRREEVALWKGPTGLA